MWGAAIRNITPLPTTVGNVSSALPANVRLIVGRARCRMRSVIPNFFAIRTFELYYCPGFGINAGEFYIVWVGQPSFVKGFLPSLVKILERVKLINCFL